ncbi:MAG: alginate lyase family protein, partial [Thermodesulfobacteriota bacterium]
ELQYGRIINVWELNRHFYFYDLGKAFALTGDRRFAETLIRHLESWIDQNPIGIGINWYSPMECGLRLVSWLWGLFFISERGRSGNDLSLILPPENRQKILTSIYWQTYYIEKDLSKYSSANNHLVGEALGLFWVGSLLPFLGRAQTWRRKGWTILVREIEKQVFPDGVSKEQSTRYLFFLFDVYALAIRLAQKQSLAIPRIIWDRLEKICEYIMAQMDEGGNLPDWGDSSDGLACRLHATSFHPYRSLLTNGAIWFNRGDFKYWGRRLDERNFWLGSKDEIQRYEELEPEASERESRIFPEGGQLILRKGREGNEAVLSFDAGSFGFLSIAAHAHADALSFTLSVGGTPILIDPGTYLYHDGGKWRYYFRGTRAHNTIEVDGQDQAVSGGPFMWFSKPKVFMTRFVLNPDFDYIQAHHSGYERLAESVRHERSVFFDKKETFWVIKDNLESQGSQSIFQTFHFHPECQLKFIDSHLLEVAVNNNSILYLKVDPKFRSSLHRGEEDPLLGWFSPAFGQKYPTTTLVGEKQIKGSETFLTLLCQPKAYEMVLKRVSQEGSGDHDAFLTSMVL